MIYSFGKVLKSKESESSPFIDLNNNWTLNDLLQPGFPTMNNGILEVIQTNNTNILFNRASFFVIPEGN